jgi:trk system potassium uptake protein TrkA
MQIIVAGCGKVGSGFAQVMSEQGHEISVIDEQNDNFALLGPNFKGITIWGSPIDEDILKEAGIETADGFVAATPDDNINTMACQVAKEIFNVPKIFARVQDPVREEVLYQFGVSTVCPTNMTIKEFRSLLLGEAGCKSFFFDLNVGVDFGYKKVDFNDKYKLLSEISHPKDVHLLGVIRHGLLEFANPGLRLELDDEIVYVRKI